MAGIMPEGMVLSSRTHRFVAILAVFAVLGLGLLPAEHIHDTPGEPGHPHALFHSHLDSHRDSDHATAWHTDDVHVEDADDDAHAIWIGAVFTHPDATPTLNPLDVFVLPRAQVAVPGHPAGAVPQRVYMPVHGPPGAPPDSLRAPPSLPV